jgi:phosphatidylinositol alpha-1,6-mannosyltransferase
MPHLLVTNDFPPKVGGIQSYLWELWHRLPPGTAAVLTTPHARAGAFDAGQPLPVRRTQERVLLPTRSLARRVGALADELGAGLVVLDPVLPLGLVAARLRRPYAVVLHGAEVTVPGRLPATRQALARVVLGAAHLIAAGPFPAAEAAHAVGGWDRLPPLTVVPPGVDTERFHPLEADRRAAIRHRLGLPADGRLVLSVSRLVPRKGMDVLIEAGARLAEGRPDLVVAVAGAGRDRGRLERLARKAGAPVRFLGRISDADLPGLYACADVFAMCCRNRWGSLEQEGFGIVFLEAAASGLPAVAGASGGAADAVADGRTGVVVHRPADPVAVVAALAPLLDHPDRCRAMGAAARTRVEAEFAYPLLADRLAAALAPLAGAVER